MNKKLILPCLSLIACAAGLLIVNHNCKEYADIQSRIDDRPAEVIAIEQNDAAELDALVEEMFAEIEQENLFKQAYLNHSCHVDENDVRILGNIIYNEAKGCSKLEQSCVAWTVLNRCDRDDKSIEEIVSIPKQFAYKPQLKLKSDAAKSLLKSCEDLARDVIIRHACEQDGIENCGRTLPNNYYSYWGDGKENHFRTNVGVYEYWDYSLGNPYI